MSARRRWFELRLLMRQRPFLCIGLIAGILFLLYILSRMGGDTDSTYVAPKRANVAEEWRDEEGDIPGGADPGAVFTHGQLGNYEPKVPETPSNQPGERGEPVYPTDPKAQELSRAANNEFGFNTYVSDMISMNRTIPDSRMDECKYWSYPEKLPTVSVVIVFHNEGWTPLLRTVHSVFLRSPSHLLHEVVMVDDYSDKEHLGQKLDKYIEKNFHGKVKLVRTGEREGLIRARSIGAKNARADVIIFLDAHCEVNTNWLPPLLSPIKNNRKVMTVPVIDGIDMNTWEYRSVYGRADKHFRGIFEWGLLYKETEIPQKEKDARQYNSMPFRSPTHAGGLFAIDRLWFEELGFYDEGLQIWGGEQYELSFKIWQCGGGILFIPCSHVGHVYRSHMPYGFGKLTGKPVISTNMVRVIKTWMDEYDKYYYIREPSAQHRKPGDISAQLALKQKLNCKPFKWYMEKVAYDVVDGFPLLPENHVWGEAKNAATGKCIDTMGRSIPNAVGATPCHGYGGNQLIRLNRAGQLAQGEWCITPARDQVKTGHCKKGTVDGVFSYDEETQQIAYKKIGLCLTAAESANSHELTLKRCDPQNELQKWRWREIFTD